MLPVLHGFNYTHFDLMRFEAERDSLNETILNYTELKDSLLKVMLESNTALIERCEQLKAYYQDLCTDIEYEKRSKQPKPEPKQPEPEYEPEIREVSEKVKTACKKLFKKISNICHPDKVGNSKLVTFYHQAHGAYKAYDHQALVEILNLLNDKKKRAKHIKDVEKALDSVSEVQVLLSLDEQIDALKFEIETLTGIIKAFAEDEFHFVVKIYETHGMEVAKDSHASIIKTSIEFYLKKIKEKQNILDTLKGKYQEFDFSFEE